MRGSQRAGSINTLSKGGRGGGENLLVVGVICAAWCLFCLMVQVTTNEAWIDGVKTVTLYKPDLTVFLQIPYMFFGWIPADRVPGVLFSWGVEIISLAITQAGFSLIHRAAHTSGLILGIAFEVVAFGAYVFNWNTDYMYGTIGSGPWGHFLFALVMAVSVGFLGNVGILLIRRGWSGA